MPSVWLSDEYSSFPPVLARAGADQQAAAANAFIAKLHERGTYPVGGAGGCTLISRAVIDAGTSFKALPNVSFLERNGTSASEPPPWASRSGLTPITRHCTSTGKRTSAWQGIFGHGG